MNERIIGCIAAALLLVACGNDTAPESSQPASDEIDASEQLAALVEEYYQRDLEMNPLNATQVGDDRFDDRIANWFGPEHIAKSEAMDEEFLQRLLEIDSDELKGQDWLTYEAFKLTREESIAGQQFPGELQLVHHFFSVPNFFVQLGSGASIHPFKTVKNYDDFLSRIDDYVVLNDQMIENMKIGMQKGIVLPRILMEKTLPQLESQLVEHAEDSAFYMPITNMPEDFSDADRERLTAAYVGAIENKVVPAYQRLRNFIGDEYLSAARE